MEFQNSITFSNLNLNQIGEWDGKICLIVSNSNLKSPLIDTVDKKVKGFLRECLRSSEFRSLSDGKNFKIPYLSEIKATSIEIIKLENFNDIFFTREIGSGVVSSFLGNNILLLFDRKINICEFLYGFILKSYAFTKYKTQKTSSDTSITVCSKRPSYYRNKFNLVSPVIGGINLTRDLVNEPANILNTEEFADRISSLSSEGLKIEILDDEQMESLGMNALLAVGRGSINPPKLAVLEWKNGLENKKPLVLLGKGVVFDSGGISMKPAVGMDEMIMDMGGAAVVVGVMQTIARRQAKANVVGIVGLVENMPDGNAQRPGDIVKSMRGDTIEVKNTDAEGRLVLADLLCYAQRFFSPSAIIDLATLTGAIITALGYENAGVFSNNDELCKKFLTSAKLEGEGAWRMPLSKNYEKLLKSSSADIANIGGRAGASITAAKFLERFIENDIPWIHIDIAGVAFKKNPSILGPGGATGWGVSSLNRMISDYFEQKI